jgi:hypothetical protein
MRSLLISGLVNTFLGLERKIKIWQAKRSFGTPVSLTKRDEQTRPRGSVPFRPQAMAGATTTHANH